MAYEMVMPYHLHMPSYFLETFTEYPYKLLEQTRPAIYYFERNKELTFRFFTSFNRS